MNKKRLNSYLTTGVIIGAFIDFFFVLIAGVFSKELYNYIVVGICSVIPVLSFTIPVIIELNRYGRINMKKAIIFLIIFIIIAFGLGFGIEVLINKVFNIEICKIGRMETALYETFIGSLLATILNNIYYKIIKK